VRGGKRQEVDGRGMRAAAATVPLHVKAAASVHEGALQVIETLHFVTPRPVPVRADKVLNVVDR